MTREEKEKFIQETWESVNEPEDVISLTALAGLSERELDRMVELYKAFYNK